MNANELADVLEDDYWDSRANKVMLEGAKMLRQQQAEIEALKMGFANSGTHDSELAETRAMAGRLFLKVQDLEFEQEGYENLTEMLESEKAELTEKNCQQQAEIEVLKSHPVKELTLSIGEIHAVWAAGNYYELDKYGQVDEIKFTEFATAILRKAQE
jgi:hypothetical protein